MKIIKNKKAIMLAMTISLLSGAAAASPVTIYLEGSYFLLPNPTVSPFTAQISYDTDTSFGPYGSGGTTQVAGDQFVRSANLGSITVFANGQSESSTVYSMIVSKNEDNGQPGSIFNPPTHVYSSAIIFYSPKYIFAILGSQSSTPYIWTNNLLPTPSDPVPFSASGIATSFNLQSQTVPISFNVSSYSLTPPSSVPVPSSAWLLGSGLLGLSGIARRRK